MFAALARLAVERPWRIVLAAAILALFAGAVSRDVQDRLGPYKAEDPASESVKVSERLRDETGVRADNTIVALARTDAPARSPAGRGQLAQAARELRDVPGVGRVVAERPDQVSRDGRSAYMVASLRAGAVEKDVVDAAQRSVGDSRGVMLGGGAGLNAVSNDIVKEDLKVAEPYALPILFLLSLLFFRSLVAALLPLLVGVLSILLTFLGLRIASEAVDLSVFALNLVTALGMGLAIDWSLFMVSRFREELERHGPDGRAEALRETMCTAGRTVLFSSLTVAAALAALLTFPQEFLYSMGLGGMVVALIAATVSLTLLPAVLFLLGPRVYALAPKRLQRAAKDDAQGTAQGAWYRLSRFVMRRPLPIALATSLLLVVLALPALDIRFTAVDATVLPAGEAGRQVDASLRADFDGAATGPVLVVADAGPKRAAPLVGRLRGLPGVAAVAPPEAVAPGLSSIDVVPRARVLDDATQALVRDIRALPAPFPLQVAGPSAAWVDEQESLLDHLPIAALVVCLTTLLVLFAMTGSVVLPVKALLMNVLSLCAALGVLVFIFQEGHLESLLGFRGQGALESSSPLVVAALAFGLSTDYGVFLLSRIKEIRDGGEDDGEAVALGLERTGRIVSAAALLFCVAVGAIVTSRIIFIKELGLGASLAVLIDATIVRALLVPSLMALLGRWNWWAPAPLRRLHARFGMRE